MTATPFVVGQWVRGEKFYGRSGLLEEILEGHRNWLWVLGTRRIGKTSLLKQIEHITTRSEDTRRYFPVFWDFQGSDSSAELHMGFQDAMLDAEERLETLGIGPGDVEHDDLFLSLGKLRRKLRSKGRRLLLLCDEVEELITLNQKDAALLRKLRRALQSTEDVRSVFASTIRLWALAGERGDTSPFLHGFAPPLYIHNLNDDDAEALIRQANMPSDSRPLFDDAAVEFIRSHCDNHPYLVQLLCKRFQEIGELEEAVEQVATDSMVSYFFSVDFEMLSPAEQDILAVVARTDASASNSIQQRLALSEDQLSSSLHRLEHLGYVRRNPQRQFVLANYFFRRWFREQPGQTSGPSVWDDTGLVAGGTLRDEPSAITSIPESRRFDGRYDLAQKIGTGAMGVVYKAYDTVIKDYIAIKILRPEYAGNDEALERFRQETWLARDLGHPSILRLYHLGDCEGQKYLTMKWIDGTTLAKMIRAQGKLPIDRMLGLSIKLASALEHAHEAGIIHRDVKPQNILVDADDQPFLTDFGLARLRDRPGVTKSGVFLGTPDYASPEQANLKPVDNRSDVYSLGVVMFEMLTGRRPFIAGSLLDVLEMHRKEPPPNPQSLREDTPERLSEAILRCLEKSAARRFENARALRLALERVGAPG